MMVSELSTITGLAGYDQEYSLPEFKEHLSADLSSKKCNDGWVFWRPEIYQRLEYELLADEGLDNVSSFGLPVSSSFVGREIEDKIKFLLEEMASHTWERKYLVQFWAPEAVDQQHLYLTTSDQPFAVGLLCRGLCWYRQHCMPHRYRVDEGANEKELGSVGRVYRNLHPESSPDLRLYSTTEFPLRDYAAGCGGRAYLALPVFDLPKEKCYGVIEVLSFDDIDVKTTSLESALQAAKLRSTHLHFSFIRLPFFRDADSEIAEMLELAIRLIPQLQLAQVWVPCHECCKRSNNLSCMKRATFINAEDEIVNLVENVDYDIYDYLVACHLHNLQIGKCTNMISAVMSSNNKSCICRNVCDFSISENPLAHYAQKARLSSCFAICLESLHDSRDFYVVEFFLQFNSREDAFVGSFLPLLLRIMEMKLKNFAFPYKGQHGEELAVEVLKENMLSSDESSQSSALRYESIRCKHQSSNKISKLMEECKKRYLLSDFTKYLQNAELHFLQPSETRMHGWTFWSRAREELSESEVNNFSLLLDRNQEKIKCLMSEITSKWDWNSYALAQFWAPKTVVDRCYLETSGQPFALGCLHKGLAFFRKQCMEHYYFAGETAKQEELGPPGRVFLNGHPEITPDLRLYSPTEFPLRNQAAHCGLRKYFALPVYELNQHKCVGVLELVEFSDSTLEAIKDALKAANLSSTHINFMPSFQGSHLPGNLALTEIKKARKLFTEIPQLYMVEVWVPYSECPSSNNTVICMERVWATKRRLESDPLMCQIQHVKTRKGIAGMALESENKSCFCQDLYEFTIVEQPLAHYARRARLDVCFAICLQSWHTGNLLYVLEFYLNQGPRKYEYLKSFLCLLLPIMKQELKSFKIASGQQLGEKLVVEVIEFSLVNEVAFSEIDQPDMFPITFKFVKYYGREQCSTSAAILKKKDAAKETKRGKKKMRLNISREDLEPYFGQKLEDVAKALGVSKSTIKRRCGDYDIQMWPWNENYRKNHSRFMRESARDYQQNMCLSCFHNLPPSDMPFHQNVMHTNPESTQGLVVPPKVDMVIIKATYGEDTIKFELCHSAGMEKLMKEVAVRLNLKLENFKLKYLDEDNDEILLACDADLQLCLKSMAAVGKTFIQVSVQSI